jgi:hypothetical protein
LMICGTNPNMVNEAAAMPNIVHHILLSFYSSLISQRYAFFALHYACIWDCQLFYRWHQIEISQAWPRSLPSRTSPRFPAYNNMNLKAFSGRNIFLDFYIFIWHTSIRFKGSALMTRAQGALPQG